MEEEEEGGCPSPRLGSSKEKRENRAGLEKLSLERGVAQDKHFPLWS